MTSIPKELRSRRQWVLWRLETREGKSTKVPHALDGRKASSTDPSTWSTYDEVTEFLALHEDSYSGIGYVFAKDDPFVGVDLDHAVEDGSPAPWARAIVASLDTYSETSPSGTGIHAILEGSLPGGHGRKNGRVEVYSEGRYFTITGRHLAGSPLTVNARQEALDELYREKFGEKEKRSGPAGGAASLLADDEVLSRARTAANGGKFKRLWSGDSSGYVSASEGDCALCGILAFWCGGDRAQIARLFLQSDRVREKTDREDYLERTIEKALEGMTTFYSGTTSTSAVWALPGGAAVTLSSVRKTPSKLAVSIAVRVEDVEYPFSVTSAENSIHATTKTILEFLKLEAEDRHEVGKILRAILTEAGKRAREKPQGKTMRDILMEQVEVRYALRFKTEKGAAWSEALGRLTWRRDFAAELASFEVIDEVRKASDCPEVDDGALHKKVEGLAGALWGDLLRSLPEQDGADLGPGSHAAEDMRRLVTEAWLSPAGPTREPLVVQGQRAAEQAKEPGWRRPVYGVPAWCQRTAGGTFEYGIRWEAFKALGIKTPGLRSHEAWVTAARRYGLGTDARAGRERTRMIALSADATRDLSACMSENDKEA